MKEQPYHMVVQLQEKVKAHEPIMIDFGIQYQNYQSDMTRMCFIGEPDPKIKRNL